MYLVKINGNFSSLEPPTNFSNWDEADDEDFSSLCIFFVGLEAK